MDAPASRAAQKPLPFRASPSGDRGGKNGDLALAHTWLDPTLQLEPADETAHRAKMRLYHLQGERPLALKHYEICKRALARELAVQPERETEALRQKISQTGNSA